MCAKARRRTKATSSAQPSCRAACWRRASPAWCRAGPRPSCCTTRRARPARAAGRADAGPLWLHRCARARWRPADMVGPRRSAMPRQQCAKQMVRRNGPCACGHAGPADRDPAGLARNRQRASDLRYPLSRGIRPRTHSGRGRRIRQRPGLARRRPAPRGPAGSGALLGTHPQHHRLREPAPAGRAGRLCAGEWHHGLAPGRPGPGARSGFRQPGGKRRKPARRRSPHAGPGARGRGRQRRGRDAGALARRARRGAHQSLRAGHTPGRRIPGRAPARRDRAARRPGRATHR